MYQVKYTRYNVPGTMYAVQCTQYNVRGSRYAVKCAPYNFAEQYTRYIVQRTMYVIQCTQDNVRGTMYTIQCINLYSKDIHPGTRELVDFTPTHTGFTSVAGISKSFTVKLVFAYETYSNSQPLVKLFTLYSTVLYNGDNNNNNNSRINVVDHN